MDRAWTTGPCTVPLRSFPQAGPWSGARPGEPGPAPVSAIRPAPEVLPSKAPDEHNPRWPRHARAAARQQRAWALAVAGEAGYRFRLAARTPRLVSGPRSRFLTDS